MAYLRLFEAIFVGHENMSSELFKERIEKAESLEKEMSKDILDPQEYFRISQLIHKMSSKYGQKLSLEIDERFLTNFEEGVKRLIKTSTFEDVYQFYLERKDRVSLKDNLRFKKVCEKVLNLQTKIILESEMALERAMKIKEEKVIELGILDVRKNIEDFEKEKMREIEELERKIKEVRERKHCFGPDLEKIEKKVEDQNEVIKKAKDDLKTAQFGLSRESATKIFFFHFNKVFNFCETEESVVERGLLVIGNREFHGCNKVLCLKDEKKFLHAMERLSIEYTHDPDAVPLSYSSNY